MISRKSYLRQIFFFLYIDFKHLDRGKNLRSIPKSYSLQKRHTPLFASCSKQYIYNGYYKSCAVH